MDDFASTALYNLIVTELKRQGFAATPNRQFAGKIDRHEKANLLAAALQQLGPSAILKIGLGIQHASAQQMGSVLARAVNVHDLMARWQRLESYFHGKHRVRILEHGEKNITLEHISLSNEKSSRGEDLVIAGLLAALMQKIGVERLNLKIDDHLVIANSRIQEDLSQLQLTSIWSFNWDRISTVQCEIIQALPAESVLERLSNLFMSDPGRGWKLALAAKVLAMSTRNLQRQLAQEGVSFQVLLRSVRADTAASLMTETESELAQIGYLAGFSDQAHFSRDFKVRFNMTPREYLKLNR